MTSPSVVESLVRVIAHAIGVFGDEQKATHWLSTPLEILGKRSPAELMVSEEGIAIVEQALSRIEHDVKGQIELTAERHTVQNWLDRAARSTPIIGSKTPAQIIRQSRDAR